MTTEIKSKKELHTKWAPLLESESGDVEAIVGRSKQEVVARILENQEADFTKDRAYSDEKIVEAFGGFLAEAEIGGDHGYDATNIAAGQTSGAVTHIGPAVMGMLRRAIPNLIAFDIAGVQPMNLPTSQIFSLRATYGGDPLAAGAKEAFHPMHAPNTMHSGRGATETFALIKAGDALVAGEIYRHEFVETGTAHFQAAVAVTVDAAATNPALLDAEILELVAAGTLAEISEAMATSVAELQEGFNGSTGNPWAEMSFRIDKTTVEAKARQLKAQYSIELAQDLRAVHGMDADAELAGILSTEIMLEINREVVDWINYSAQIGKTGVTLTPGSKAGVFDLQDPIDVKGARWQGEAFKAFLFQIDKEATEIGRQTGRGAGNFIIASRNVVNLLASVDSNVSPAAAGLTRGLNADTNKAVFSGILGGRYKVFIDLYAREEYITVGYKGSTELDAGIYYAPYVALTPVRATDPKSFASIMGFKTRYAIGINPFANSAAQAPGSRIGSGMPDIVNALGKNAYFRRFRVKGI